MCQESLNSNPAILSSLLSLGQVDVALFFARGQRGSCFFAAAAMETIERDHLIDFKRLQT